MIKLLIIIFVIFPYSIFANETGGEQSVSITQNERPAVASVGAVTA